MAKYDAMNTIYENVTSLLESRCWTIQDLADQLGIDRSQLSKVIRGQNDPRLGTLQKIAAEFGLEVYELLTPGKLRQKVAG